MDSPIDDAIAFKEVNLQYRSWADPLYIPEKYINVQAITSIESFEAYQADIDNSTEKVTIFRLKIPTNGRDTEKLRVLHKIYSNVLQRSQCKHLDPQNTLMLYTKGNSVDEMKHVYFVLPTLFATLENVVRSNAMTLSHIAWILYQIIWRMHCCYDLGLLPGSIRGMNLLLNEECDIEFLSVTNGFVNHDLITEAKNSSSSKIFLPFYKDVIGWKCAPEWKIFSNQEAVYSSIQTDLQSMDLWSVGALACHMTLGRPAFPDDPVDCINSIINTLAHFPESVLSTFPENVQKYIQDVQEKCRDPKTIRENLMEMFPDSSLRTYDGDSNNADIDYKDHTPENFRDLLAKLLELDPAKRLSISDILQHPFLNTFYDSDDLKPLPRLEMPNTFNNHSIYEASSNTLKELIFWEIQQYKVRNSCEPISLQLMSKLTIINAVKNASSLQAEHLPLPDKILNHLKLLKLQFTSTPDSAFIRNKDGETRN